MVDFVEDNNEESAECIERVPHFLVDAASRVAGFADRIVGQEGIDELDGDSIARIEAVAVDDLCVDRDVVFDRGVLETSE